MNINASKVLTASQGSSTSLSTCRQTNYKTGLAAKNPPEPAGKLCLQ